MEPEKLLEALHTAEKLKDTTRHCYTSMGRHESVAEHSWRIALMAFWLRDEFPQADMNAKEKIEELLEASEDGTITAAQVTEAGLHRSVLQEFVKSGEMYRFGRGLYVRSSAWEDDFYLLQRKYGRGIYSHDTALYLLGYSDRTPAKYTMTFPKGYNAPSLKQENLIIKRVVPENYEFGRIEIESPSGNPIRVYDLERTLCDILRGSGSDVQIVGEAMKRYAASKDKNIHKLMQYADQLRVKPKVLRYMEVLL